MHPIVEKFNRSRKPRSDWKAGAVIPLAKHLAKAKGMNQYFLGPFGVRAACTIVLYRDKNKPPLEQEHWSITVMPHFVGDRLELWYDTFRVVREYPDDSIGALNNMGNEVLPLPETTEEIYELMEHYMDS